MAITRLLVLLLCFLIGSNVNMAQKVMLLEVRGEVESRRYYIGDELDIKLYDDDHGWYRAFITDFNVDREIIYFDFGTVRVNEIAAIRTEKQFTTPRAIRNKLLLSGASFIALSPLNLAIGEDYPVWALYVGGSLIASAFLQEFILDKTLKHKMGKRKRLRLVDLNFYGLPNESNGP